MTKVYAGNDTWEIHLNSGQGFILTQDEIDDIILTSDIYEDMETERDDYKNENIQMLISIQEHLEILSKIEEKIPTIKRVKIRDELLDLFDELDGILAQHI